MVQRRVGAFGKLLANYAADDAIIAAGEAAELLFCRAVAWLSTSDSDGYITDSQLIRYVGAGMRDAKKRADTLVREGLWLRADGGYQVRSYLKINESAEEKGRKKRTDRERKRKAPSGVAPDSAWNPDGFQNHPTPESLTALTVTEVVTEAVQSKEVKGRAAVPNDGTDEPPSWYCPNHPKGTDDKCGPCADARRRRTEWDAAAPERKRRAAADRRSSIDACDACDADGWLLNDTGDPSAFKCDHPHSRTRARAS